MVNRDIGCAELPHGVGWERYFSKLSFLETSAIARGPVKPSVLARWRAAAPGPGAFALVAPPIVANPLDVERGIDALVAAASTLEASVVVFRTPPSFSPSAANRDLLRRFFTEIAADLGGERVWHPDGLWDTRTAAKLATELGVTLAVDPLVRDQTREPPEFYATLEVPKLYMRVSGIGRGARKLASSQLEEIELVASVYERTWIVFATTDALGDATRFRSRT